MTQNNSSTISRSIMNNLGMLENLINAPSSSPLSPIVSPIIPSIASPISSIASSSSIEQPSRRDSIALDFRRQFPQYQLHRSGKRSKQSTTAKLSRNTWTATFCCCARTTQKTTLSNDDQEEHLLAGLGKKKVTFHNKKGDHRYLVAMLEKQYDKLEMLNGSFHLYRSASGGSGIRDLRYINMGPDGYTVPWIKDSCNIGTACIYIKPLQMDLSLDPISISASPDAPMVDCFMCKRSVLLADMECHMSSCKDDRNVDNRVPTDDLFKFPLPGSGLETNFLSPINSAMPSNSTSSMSNVAYNYIVPYDPLIENQSSSMYTLSSTESGLSIASPAIVVQPLYSSPGISDEVSSLIPRKICLKCHCTYLDVCEICPQNKAYTESELADQEKEQPTIPITQPYEPTTPTLQPDHQSEPKSEPNEQPDSTIMYPLSPRSLRERRLLALGADDVMVPNDTAGEDECAILECATIHRSNIIVEMLKLFSGDSILTKCLQVTMVDIQGNEELGEGEGVVRDSICQFFEEISFSHMSGCQDKVPAIRHDMNREDWEALGRIVIYGLKVGYFPLYLSCPFVISILFQEEKVTSKLLLDSFKQYISGWEKEVISRMLTVEGFDATDEDLLEILSQYNTYSAPKSCDQLLTVLNEIAHKELIQKPRYVANCFADIWGRNLLPTQLSSVDCVLDLYDKKKPSARKVIKAFKTSKDLNASEEEVMGYLQTFIRKIDLDVLKKFLRFVTGSDNQPSEILVEFKTNQNPRAPRSRTCGNILEIEPSYRCNNELVSEFHSVLKNGDSFRFSYI